MGIGKLEAGLIGLGIAGVTSVTVTAIITKNRALYKEYNEKKKKLELDLEKFNEKKEEIKKEKEYLKKKEELIYDKEAEFEALMRDLKNGENGSMVSVLYRMQCDLIEIKTKLEREGEYKNRKTSRTEEECEDE